MLSSTRSSSAVFALSLLCQLRCPHPAAAPRKTIREIRAMAKMIPSLWSTIFAKNWNQSSKNVEKTFCVAFRDDVKNVVGALVNQPIERIEIKIAANHKTNEDNMVSLGRQSMKSLPIWRQASSKQSLQAVHPLPLRFHARFLSWLCWCYSLCYS